MRRAERIRIATYNIHKCVGMDRRQDPARIAAVLRELDADIIALQEVLCVTGRRGHDDQAHFLAHELGFDFRIGHNRAMAGGLYGNVILSRFPMGPAENHDISVAGREERGCLRVDVEAGGGRTLRIYNVHLGTSFLERRAQARRLLDESILGDGNAPGPRVMLGDFNEWTRGLTTQLLRRHFQAGDIRPHLGAARSYPGVLPLLHLDHIYFDESLTLAGAALHRSRRALVASDHLPIRADFTCER
ncbi:MAG: endonuclease/exonuclease/phosphatase family protein [Blastocatellia bacterium]